MRQLEQLDRYCDPGDLAREPGDRLAEEQAAKRPRLAQRAEVDRDSAQEASGPRRRGADRLLLVRWLRAAQLEKRLGFAGLRRRLEQLPGSAAKVVDVDSALLGLLGHPLREIESLVE